MTRRTPTLNAPAEDRPALAQDTEFLRFLQRRQADAQHDADRLQSEIDTLLEQVHAKQREQAEYLTIVEACTAGLGVTDKSNRPAPTLTARQPAEETESSE